jgi:hypothetical protein
VRRRDPGLRQPTVGEQLSQPAGVLAVGLRAPLLATQRARLDRLGEMRNGARLGERLANEQPARARLDPDMNFLAGKAPNPLANTLRCGANPATPKLPRLAVQSVESDLRSMHIKPGYDRHWGLL